MPPDRPFALVESTASGLLITAVNDAAARAGVTPGTALADARAAHPGLLSRPAEPAKDRHALLRLARWAGRYGPNRHVDGRDGLWIDVTGVAHLFGGEQNLLDDLSARLASFGVPAMIGLADTLGAAHALARFGVPRGASWTLAPAGATGDRLAPLSVEALRLAALTVLTLKRLGLRRIGQLYTIPRDSLARRFRSGDAASSVLTRLDQALGVAAEPMRPMQTLPALSLARAFAEPLISSEALEAAAGELCVALADTLKEQALGAKAVRLVLFRSDGTTGAVAAAMSTPCCDGAHMMRLLSERLAAIDAGFGVDLVRLEAVRVAPHASRQTRFAESEQSGEAAPTALVDRLSNRFGAEAIVVLESRASHIPERAQRRPPAMEALAKVPLASFAYAPPWPYAKGPPRPAFILERPEPIDVIAEVPDGPPARFTWRRIERRVVHAEGPERIAPEWWRALSVVEAQKRPRPRDYFRIEDCHGTAYWVFRHGLYGAEEDLADGAPPRWFLHGLFA